MRSAQEIEDMLEKTLERKTEILSGDHQGFFGMSFEDGIDDTLRWVLGETDDSPLGE